MVTKRNFAGDDCSLIGFGCMRFPCDSEGKIDEAEAYKMLDAAYESGVNYYDTAYPYHNGMSEPFIGRWMKRYPRESIKLATKLPVWLVKSREDAIRLFNEQLERLDVEYFDYYLLHSIRCDSWENVVLKFDIIPLMEEFQAQGKIKHLGFSFHDDYAVFEEMLNYRKWDFCQIQYNYIDTEHQAGDKGYELAKSMGVPMVIMEPIRGGLLASLPEDVEEKFRAMDGSKTLADWALSWVATHDNVKVVLSGMSTMEQVKGNIDTFTDFISLTDEQMDGIKDIVTYINSKVKNKCTGCRYCMPCPFGVYIPKNFQKWNEFGMYGRVPRGYKIDTWTADKCKGCRACVDKCPQSIDIPSNLKQMLVDIIGN